MLRASQWFGCDLELQGGRAATATSMQRHSLPSRFSMTARSICGTRGAGQAPRTGSRIVCAGRFGGFDGATRLSRLRIERPMSSPVRPIPNSLVPGAEREHTPLAGDSRVSRGFPSRQGSCSDRIAMPPLRPPLGGGGGVMEPRSQRSIRPPSDGLTTRVLWSSSRPWPSASAPTSRSSACSRPLEPLPHFEPREGESWAR